MKYSTRFCIEYAILDGILLVVTSLMVGSILEVFFKVKAFDFAITHYQYFLGFLLSFLVTDGLLTHRRFFASDEY